MVWSRLRYQLILQIVGSVVVVLVLMTASSTRIAATAVTAEVQQRVRALADLRASEIDGFLQSVSRVAVVLGNAAAADVENNEDLLRARIRETVAGNPEVYGSTVAFEPGAFLPDRRYFAPYYYRSGDEIRYTQLGADTYVYWDWEWYAGPRDSGGLYWTAPYYDEGGGNVWMTTASYPVRRAGRFVGVATVDVDIAQLKGIVRGLRVGQRGYALMLDQHGKLIATGQAEEEAEGKRIQEWPAEAERPEVKGLIARVLAEGRGLETLSRDPFTGSPFSGPGSVWAIYAPVPSTGWRILVLASAEEMLAPRQKVLRANLAIAAAGVAILVLVVLWVSRTISRPLEGLRAEALRIADGDLTRRVPVTTHNELGAVGQAFNGMVERLSGLMGQEQAQRARLEQANQDLAQSMARQQEREAQLRQVLAQVRRASADLSAVAADMLAAATAQARGADQQSEAIEQTAATMDQVREISEHGTRRAQEVAEAAAHTVTVSQAGIEAVSATIASVSEIRERVARIADGIRSLTEGARQIGEIIASVRDFSEQSNILALNASITATRAGEHGKGFAVIAAEVRDLAVQSRQATARVRELLEEIQTATHAAVMATEEGTTGADQGVQCAAQARTVIGQLAGVIAESAQAATQMAGGGRQQAGRIDEIASAMQGLRDQTAQGLTGARQAERTARELSALAARLAETVTEYES